MCYGFHAQNAESKLLADINTDDYMAHCRGWLPEEIAAVTVVYTVLVIVMCALAKLLHKYRYRVATCVTHALRAVVERSQLDQKRPIDYDLYLSYDTEDLVWIHNLLLQELETLRGFTCCLPDRDFPLAGSLPDMTCDFMDRCRCILVFIGKRPVPSNHRKFELRRVQDLALTQGRQIVCINLHDFVDDVTPDVRQVLRLGRCIAWPTGERDEKQIDRFFKRLVAAIRGSVVCCG